MNPEMTQAAMPSPSAPIPEAKGKKENTKRRGVVLVAVLIVVSSLSLMAYHYSDSMVSESKASDYAHRNVQARAFAESGIHYAASMLSSPDNINNYLGGNPWNNPLMFQGISVPAENMQGYFSIIAPPNVDNGDDPTVPNFGVIDESSKINLNSMMKLDPTGQQLHDMLVLLPNMTEDIANSIVAWMGGTVGITNGGAQNDYYTGLNPPYRCKNGPIDSIDELLLIRGVTRDLLYGTDYNRNGVNDGPEVAYGFDRGWSAYLTVHSREQNSDSTGKPFIYLNNTDLTQLSTDLTNAGISDDLVKFIIMFRQYPPASSSGSGSQSLGSTIAAALGLGGGGNSSNTPVANELSSFEPKLTKAPSYQMTSLFNLVGVKINISSVDPETKKTVTKQYTSPLNPLGEPTQMASLLAQLYAVTTCYDGPEIPSRININTAPQQVLATLPGLADTDVANIIAARPQVIAADAAAQNAASYAWLLTDAKINLKTLVTLEQYITARTQVYRVQSVGYFDGKGPAIRVEAVIDTNAGRPRIIAWRDLSELGKGWNPNP
jgi:type II secretory pathway component PulK